MAAAESAIPLYVHSWGAGPQVVLVHGGVLGGRETWRAQRPLTDRWTLLAPDRPGHGRTLTARQDFETEARLLTDQLLDRPVHLVGFSYGGLVSLYAASYRPEHIRSLTIIEPPLFAVARGNPEVDATSAATRAVIEDTAAPAEVALARFFPIAGVPITLTEPVSPVLVEGIRQLQGARPPDEAEPPLEVVRAAGFPMLVISGGHRQVYEDICDELAAQTGAERAVCPGMGHLVPDTGAPFNELLDEFLRRAEKRAN